MQREKEREREKEWQSANGRDDSITEALKIAPNNSFTPKSPTLDLRCKADSFSFSDLTYDLHNFFFCSFSPSLYPHTLPSFLLFIIFPPCYTGIFRHFIVCPVQFAHTNHLLMKELTTQLNKQHTECTAAIFMFFHALYFLYTALTLLCYVSLPS